LGCCDFSAAEGTGILSLCDPVSDAVGVEVVAFVARQRRHVALLVVVVHADGALTHALVHFWVETALNKALSQLVRDVLPVLASCLLLIPL
jgi:hypothetical protein